MLANLIPHNHDQDHVAESATPLPTGLDYFGIQDLKMELREKLTAAQPATIAAASRIQGWSGRLVDLTIRHDSGGLVYFAESGVCS